MSKDELFTREGVEPWMEHLAGHIVRYIDKFRAECGAEGGEDDVALMIAEGAKEHKAKGVLLAC